MTHLHEAGKVQKVFGLGFAALVAAAIFPPFVKIAGPLSFDDVLPLLAVASALPLLFRSPKKVDATLIAFGFLIFAALLSSTWNAQSFAEFARLSAKSAGRIGFYVVMILLARTIFCDRAWARRAALFIVVAATLEAMFAVYAYVFEFRGPYEFGLTRMTSGKLRTQGTFGGEPAPFEREVIAANFLAAYHVLTVPLSVGFAISSKRKRGALLFFAMSAVQIASLYLTFTRAAWIALVFGLIALMWLIGRKKTAALVLLVGALLAVSVPTIRHRLFFESHDRTSLHWAGAAVAKDHLLFGIGDGKYQQVLNSDQKYSDTPHGAAWSTPHHSILLSAAQYGLLGGVAHAFLYALVFLIGVSVVSRCSLSEKAIAAGILAGILGFFLQDQMNNLAYVPKVATQMWFLFALLPSFLEGEDA